MLNPTYPKYYKKKEVSPYHLDNSILKKNIINNTYSDTGPELRLQEVYADEIWLKLKRAGFSPEKFNTKNILEPCAGTGFLFFHLLKKCSPKSLILNDISLKELERSKKLLSKNNFFQNIKYFVGDINNISIDQSIDLIIGNSFLHHFNNVGNALTNFANLLPKGGIFISLHEPTEIASVVESGKLYRYPFAVTFPKLTNDIIRYKYKGKIDETDIWIFNKKKLSKLVLASGFSKVRIYKWNLLRQLYVAKNTLHLNKNKNLLSDIEVKGLKRAIYYDSILNRFLPSRFFGSFMIVCEK